MTRFFLDTNIVIESHQPSKLNNDCLKLKSKIQRG